MSEKIYRNYIYIDKDTKRVLAVRRTFDFNLTFHSKDFDVIQFASQVPLFLSQPELHVYCGDDDFVVEGPVSEEKMERITLLQRKIEILYLVRTNVQLVEQSVHDLFQEDFVDKFPIDPSHRLLVEHFLNNEKDILLRRCASFFRHFSNEVESCIDIKSLELLYRKLINNCNIGVYSALKRGRDNKDAFD